MLETWAAIREKLDLIAMLNIILRNEGCAVTLDDIKDGEGDNLMYVAGYV
ncbi:hypothetical protein LPH50_01070 [Xylella taiwanensis]|nr:hypothetical protein [Xylella taiwanensis]EWS78239.1 hypothetical protein AF72_06965 [Xylella taiwanensis]MCD8456835.1 hypothetical protein [Xylella taiwanensis]MCD8462086.1 hypothetical protein [Xylella taiwanensis]MCD8468851.1 hypothetical protein [Xylella taiwanensis]UFN10559.1 hypothetical protein LPH44_07305 [Xylella taiwanensis]